MKLSCVVAGGLAVAVVGCGGASGPRKIPADLNAEICAEARRRLEQPNEQVPEEVVDDVLRQLAEACATGITYPPEGTPAPPAPGCTAQHEPEERTTPWPPRMAVPPVSPIPFFARRSGQVPADGTPVVGGVQLPRGSRCMGYWASDAVLERPIDLARKLAAVFPETGLWPILWDSGAGDPDPYARRVGDPSSADHIDVRGVLRRLSPAVDELAKGGGGATPDPFAAVTDIQYPMLVLVPVNRPADVLSVLGGFIDTRYMSDAELTAVVRSWEERFGAVVTAMQSTSVELAVGHPPRDRVQNLRLAREYYAFQPDNGSAYDRDGFELAAELPSMQTWDLGWPD